MEQQGDQGRSCMNCAEDYCNAEGQSEIYSCPQCRETFRPRSVKNINGADLVVDLNKAEPQAAPADSCYAGPEDVACDFCMASGRKRKANMSCLQCVASYCEQHLQPHYEVVPLKKHKLVEASATLQDSICSLHNEVMKIFCCTDKQIICSICALEQHKGHDKVVAEAEITKRQERIRSSRQEIQQRIQDREKDIDLLQQELEAIDCSADKVLNDSEGMSTELIQLIHEKKSDLEAKIKSQKKYENTRTKKLQDELKQKITELKEKDAELERLSHRENQTELLCKYPSLSCLRESTISPNISNIWGRSVRYFEGVTTDMSEAIGRLQDSCSKEWKKILMTVSEVDVLLPQEPKTRDELYQYAVDKKDFKLDPNTAHVRLILSNGNRKATCKKEPQPADSSSCRFEDRSQVLSVQSLTGRCYFEVQWSGMSAFIAVAYKDIARAGEESSFGQNDKSWVLECSSKGCTFKHSSESKSIPGPQHNKIGVFLDHRAGFLSFHSISKREADAVEEINLLHRVKTTFTKPLFAGLGVCFFGSSAEFCDIS